ncbi:SsgA family sporulation/cell division regulator [Lentzea sp. E54]|uniref:SsgA family sporulation/cell division regulator n=1 Tax=Lentzea xerophila TaxID=3435883 RepID=UPI003DA69CBA
METFTINHSTVFELLDGVDARRDIPVDLSYDARVPYAVSVVFSSNRGPVRWLIARDVLVDGLLRQSGEGDFTVGPLHGDGLKVWIRLSTPTGSAKFEASSLAVASFLDSTFALVPLGEEDMSDAVDEAVRQMLSGVD